MRLVARVDANQNEIVAGLRSIGVSVQHIHMIGHGVPDLLCGFRGQTFLFEVKTAKGKLTPDEDAWLGEWRGHAAIVRTIEDAIAELERMTT